MVRGVNTLNRGMASGDLVSIACVNPGKIWPYYVFILVNVFQERLVIQKKLYGSRFFGKREVLTE